MNKNSRSRVDTEGKEGLEDIKNQVPENKLQTTQQIADTDSALDTKPADSSFTAKRSKVKGATLKQEAIADVLAGSSDASGMGINAAGCRVSGTAGGILGANNSTPVAGKSRSDTRVGKKLDRIATKLNYTPSEQVIVDVDESKPLADASGEDQGYNGTYRNESARAQKKLGAVPGDLMFQRSVDYIFKDKLYFVEGQQVFQVAGDKTSFNPTKSCANEEMNPLTGKLPEHNVTYHSGNFLHRALHFGLDQDGKVKYFFADTDDLTPNATITPEMANKSSAARLIKSNIAEIDRQVMDSKAGDEKADIWTPLARAVDNPTANAYFMSSIEADTGAFVATAYAKATTNMSFQLNRGPKDGLDEITPAIEECVGWRGEYDDSKDYKSNYIDLAHVFNSDYYDKGDPSIMIDAYDSKNKYKNKADLLLQPRGFRMHLQTADNNMNPLKVPTQFINVYNGQETYSTIDHEYDPTLPICVTDKASLVTVHNFNELCGFSNLYAYKITYSTTKIGADYLSTDKVLIPANLIAELGYTNFYVHQKYSAGAGLDYNSSTGALFLKASGTNVSDKDIDFYISTSATPATGYSLVATVSADLGADLVFKMPKVQSGDDTVISAATFADPEYIQTVYYKGAGPFSYVYSDMRNFYVVDVKHPLIDGIIAYLENAIGAKFYSLLGSKKELFIPLVFSTQYMTLAQLLICAATPWMNRIRMNSMKDVLYYENNIHEYPYSKLSSIKDVPFHNYVNFTFSGYDEPLQSKVMNPVVAMQWIMPEFVWKVGTSKYILPWYFNENELNIDGTVDDDASCMSFPSIRSGIRLAALDNFYGMSEKDVRLSLDRLTPLFVDKTNYKTSIDVVKAYKYGRTTDGQIYVEFDNSDYYSIFDMIATPRELGLCMDAPDKLFTFSNSLPQSLATEAGSSFRIKIWTNTETPVTPDILDSTGATITRGSNYVQRWLELKASTATSDTVLTGLVFGMNDEGAAEFKPYGALGTGEQYTNGPAIISLQRSLWTRLQLLPFVLSPFDGHTTSGGSVRDIYDLAYIFGLAGFRASDYRESVYNREKEVINQGLLFVSDPWVEASPIVKNGASSTGLSVSKGYEVKRS